MNDDQKGRWFSKTTGFYALHVENENIGVHNFLMCGSSYKTARSLTRKFPTRDDHLNRYRGKEIITGGLSAGMMRGGREKDHFYYNSISDSG